MTIKFAGAARGKKGSKGGGGRVRLSDFDIGRLSGLKYKLVCHFTWVANMVEGGIKKEMMWMDHYFWKGS